MDVFWAIYSCEIVVSLDALLGIEFEGVNVVMLSWEGYSVGRFFFWGGGASTLSVFFHLVENMGRCGGWDGVCWFPRGLFWLWMQRMKVRDCSVYW